MGYRSPYKWGVIIISYSFQKINRYFLFDLYLTFTVHLCQQRNISLEDRNAPEYQDNQENREYYSLLKKRMLRHGDIRRIQMATNYSRTTIWKVLNDNRDDVDDSTALEILKEAEKIGQQNKAISKKVKNYYGRKDN